MGYSKNEMCSLAQPALGAKNTKNLALLQVVPECYIQSSDAKGTVNTWETKQKTTSTKQNKIMRMLGPLPQEIVRGLHVCFQDQDHAF